MAKTRAYCTDASRVSTIQDVYDLALWREFERAADGDQRARAVLGVVAVTDDGDSVKVVFTAPHTYRALLSLARARAESDDDVKGSGAGDIRVLRVRAHVISETFADNAMV